MNLMQLPHEQGKNQDIEVDVVLPLFVSVVRMKCNLLSYRNVNRIE